MLAINAAVAKVADAQMRIFMQSLLLESAVLGNRGASAQTP
jgi:hypothetical protein